MKKILTLAAVLFAFYSYAQQDPYYTHFKDVLQAYNPAAAGHKYGEICLSGLTHHQWRDYDDATGARGSNGVEGATVENVAPVTYNFNANSVFNISGKSMDKFIGAGLTIIDDKIGFTKSTAIRANLNYRQQFQGGFHEFSGGLGIGAKQWGWDKPNYKAKDLIDPNIPITGDNAMKLDLSFGAMYKRQSIGKKVKDFYVGFSMTNINQAKYDVQVTTLAGNNTTLSRTYVPHYYTIVGADVQAGSLVLEPALLIKYGLLDKAYKPQVDINVTTLFAKTFRGGLAFRQWGTSDALSVLLGYETGNIKFGYSYDITLSNVQKVSNGTHEIFVRYCIPIIVKPSSILIRESVRFL
ncbi:MAG: PorP/SprF family type IX secretion system membrane protein [Bacteroidia bacterium]|jgi:type IX secretion system PorP/SprF family membrane protein|tara:strand:- start:1648 stop:2706 length:1059 start_codon:yes stop_codon:yes gene_type:complete